ncbi:MAG: bifunctional [glutamine synthetase] adenylyltransferase/[glutamine synthetase]-adenylyl-L-tyrosine phosphorylase [Gemmatimonadaceae bacterium]|nr:bifunctional [glutamine synthetase] adenylyltransferase/[glutamine synthetase]-adenylyl-L-tyrosine phosphorylase [Gemmatimonadaceae bacterium]
MGAPSSSVLAAAAGTPGFPDLRGHRPDQAAAGIDRLGEAAARAGREALAAALDSPEGRVFFSFLCGNSPYLGRLLLRDLEFTQSLVEEAPEAVTRRLLDDLAAADPAMDRDRLMAFLRRQRSRVAVVAAVYDCFGLRGVMACAELLSDMADHAVRLAVAHLLLGRARRGDLEPPAEEGRWGYFVLAMGKHGSRELNYSSDIDLIVLYDPSRVRYTGRKSPGDCFARVTRDLTGILQSRTGDGYVFRTDLRLRPDPSSTPPAITVDFALDYYLRFGRTWERTALIKARPVAGDLAAGEAFLEQLAPFIWDEGLDFASVDEIRSMSQQIHDFHGHGAVDAAGHDVKLGRGGIREIEFFVHMHQLAYGARNRRLRGPRLLAMLEVLDGEHHILPAEAATLRQSYLLLRRIEHRLQMINDDQTQKLPESADGLEHVAAFLGLPSAQELQGRVEKACREVHDLYRTRFDIPESEQDITAVILDGPEGGNPDAVERLEAAGFAKAPTAVDIFRGWAAGHHASTAPERSRAILREILHEIIEALGRTPDPDRALARMDRFLAALPEEISLFPMLRAHTWLLRLVAMVMGSAPRIADTLGGNPRLLRAVLEPGFFLPLPEREQLAGELGERLEGRGDPQERVRQVAGWAGDRRFQVGVQSLENLITVDEAAASLSHVAEVVVEVLFADVLAALEAHHGRPAVGCAVVAMGKLGAVEMTFESDLDLLLVADLPDDRETTAGPAPIEVGRFYGRAARRLIAALGSRSPSGPLYEVDMRLRPSGESGPLVTTLAAFREYHAGAAWTWEQMSLTRARVLCGDEAAAGAVGREIRQVLTRPRDPAALLRDVAGMRDRIAAEYPPGDPFELKYARGGLVDLEFIAQYLQLLHAHERPEVLAGGTAACFEALAGAGLLDDEEARFLAGAVRMQRALQGLVRLTWNEETPVREAPEALLRKLAAALECTGFGELEDRLRATQVRAFEVYEERIGGPAEGA